MRAIRHDVQHGVLGIIYMNGTIFRMMVSLGLPVQGQMRQLIVLLQQ